MFLAGSRFVSQWLNLGAPEGTDAVLDGSPVDRIIFSLLIGAGLLVLIRRKINWWAVLVDNKWVWLLFLLGAISFIWSEFPILSAKRLAKALGNVVMALVILTEKEPYTALIAVLRRLAFVTLPLSILFIKYFPDLGRTYHRGGQQLFTGVATQKNGLGQLCLLAGICFIWSLLHGRRDPSQEGRTTLTAIDVVLLALAVWLLSMANSATALACLLIAVGIIGASRVQWISATPRRILNIGLLLALAVVLLETIVDVRGMIIGSLGRDPTLTTRVPMWEELLASMKNPWIGFGYEVYWATNEGRTVSQNWAGIFQAHNGYLEMYLNLGLIGLAVLLVGIASGMLKVRRYLDISYSPAVFRMVLIVTVVLANWTEAFFRSVSNPWLLLFVGLIDPPARSSLREQVDLESRVVSRRAARRRLRPTRRPATRRSASRGSIRAR